MGDCTDRYAFTAFGELLEHQGEDPNAYLFAGESLDPNVGWYYNRARWMDPGVGRFASVDPWPGSSQDPTSLHKYLYVSNDPILATDPTGLSQLLNFTIAFAVIATLSLNIMTTFGAFALAAADDWPRFDGWVASIRANTGAVPGASLGLGLDLVLDFRTGKVWIAPVGEAGTLPVGIFGTRRGGGISALGGPILGMNSPSELSGRGSGAAWPWGIMRFLPAKLFYPNKMWSWLMYLAKRVKNGRGATVEFGFSTSGPSYVKVGPRTNTFSSIFSLTGDFRELGTLPPSAQAILQPAVDLVNGLGQLGADPAAVPEKAGEWFDRVLGFN